MGRPFSCCVVPNEGPHPNPSPSGEGLGVGPPLGHKAGFQPIPVAFTITAPSAAPASGAATGTQA